MPLSGAVVACFLVASAPVHAEGLALGLGLQDSLDVLNDPGTPSGFRAVGSYALLDGVLGLEAGLSVHSPFAPEVGPLVDTLISIAHQGDPDAGFQQPFWVNRFRTWAAADLAPVPDAFEDGFTSRPHAFVGLSLRSRRSHYASFNSDYSGSTGSLTHLSPGTNSLSMTGLLGVGIDAWYDGLVGLRLTALLHPGVESKPDYDPNDDTNLGKRLALDPVLALDLLIAI